jgi:hypothetical protein
MAALNFSLPELAAAAILFPPSQVSEADDLWPRRGTPVPDLHAHGMTEARRVIQYFYGRTIDEKLDALKHLANICTIKARNGYWSPKPFVKFEGATTAGQDWENCDPSRPWLRKDATRGWFTTQLPEHIERYSPQHTTRRELLELARLRDPDLLHVCHALVCDLLNESVKQQRHEIGCSAMWEHDGQEFYWDEKHEVAVQPSAAPSFRPDYAGAVEMLVKDKKLRAALPVRVCRTLEMVLRKLAAGVDPNAIIPTVAKDINRDERTVRRHLSQSKKAARGSSRVMAALAGLLLPDNLAVAQSTPFRPQVDALAEERASEINSTWQ